MALVERTASYLDGPGRKEAKTLNGAVGVLYATESMRLTTRLLDLASWLLIRRALRDGEITEDEAQTKRRRVKLQAFGRPSHIKGFADLPQGLKKLIEESFSLHDRISQLDRAMAVTKEAETPESISNPVAQQVGMLERAEICVLHQILGVVFVVHEPHRCVVQGGQRPERYLSEFSPPCLIHR
jgi:regulator of CtrA degradation